MDSNYKISTKKTFKSFTAFNQCLTINFPVEVKKNINKNQKPLHEIAKHSIEVKF